MKKHQVMMRLLKIRNFQSSLMSLRKKLLKLIIRKLKSLLKVFKIVLLSLNRKPNFINVSLNMQIPNLWIHRQQILSIIELSQ